ncbi:MAG: hypothetical protein O7F71_06355 [Gammaproteobacteria bacterium]|nr:hypothetical protein [Gammaproteobacteria bacterium]
MALPTESGKTRHWADLTERGTMLSLRFMLAVYEISGRWLFRPFAFLVVVYFFLSSSLARRASREYLLRVWSHTRMTHAEGRSYLQRRPTIWTSVRHFFHFSEAILDKLAAWKGDIHEDKIDYVNKELFEQRYADGKGGLWITSHIGNMEVCRAISQKQRDFKMTVLVHTRHAKNFNRLLHQVDPENSIELLEVSEFNVASAMLLQERISKGQFVAIVGDRVSVNDRKRVTQCEFIGKQANFPLGPFMLAALLDCPVGTIFCVRKGKRFHMVIDDLPGLQGCSREQRDQTIKHAVETYATRLEDLCLQYPLQWFNFFGFWDQSD